MNEVWVSIVHIKPVVSYRIVKGCWVYAERRRLDWCVRIGTKIVLTV